MFFTQIVGRRKQTRRITSFDSHAMKEGTIIPSNQISRISNRKGPRKNRRKLEAQIKRNSKGKK